MAQVSSCGSQLSPSASCRICTLSQTQFLFWICWSKQINKLSTSYQIVKKMLLYVTIFETFCETMCKTSSVDTKPRRKAKLTIRQLLVGINHVYASGVRTVPSFHCFWFYISSGGVGWGDVNILEKWNTLRMGWGDVNNSWEVEHATHGVGWC